MGVLFYDAVCPKPYSLATLNSEGLGGSEATLVRIAENLDALVFQHNRAVDEGRYRATLPDAKDVKHVICQRHPYPLADLAKLYPKAKLWLWEHDWAGKELANAFDTIRTLRVNILTVSETHKLQVQMTRAVHGSLTDIPPIRVMYNPIDDSLVPDSTLVDRSKLVFFSSPHKGLQNTVDVFGRLLSFAPEMKLYISNPGYFPSAIIEHPSVINLGVLSHQDAIKHVRSALCSFLINPVFSETFGLVFGESLAVGTPVLTHKHGAAHELLKDKRMLVDCRNNEEVITRVLSWQKERPIVSLDAKFRMSNVIRTWKALL